MHSTPTKDDRDKPTPQFLPPKAMYDLGLVAQAGARKYGDWNYLTPPGLDGSRLMGAALRHIYRYNMGHDLDEEGLHHLLCAAWSLLALYETVYRFPLKDDRLVPSVPLEDEPTQVNI